MVESIEQRDIKTHTQTGFGKKKKKTKGVEQRGDILRMSFIYASSSQI